MASPDPQRSRVTHASSCTTRKLKDDMLWNLE